VAVSPHVISSVGRFLLANGNALNVTEVMTHKILLFLYCLIIIAGASIFAFAQKSSQGVSVIGCFTDLREQSGNILGNGVIKIAKENGKYVGTFAELSNKLGLTYDEVSLKNIVVDELKLKIKFDISETGRGVTGKITKAGIKMNWGESRGEYGTANSLMKRDKDCY
jgi:hypothetical protein